MSSYADNHHATTTPSPSDTITRRVVPAMNDEQNMGSERIIKVEVAEAAPRAHRTSRIAATYYPGQTRSCKRKPDQTDFNDNFDKENISPTSPAPAVKRIRREKTGTEWQTVLDVVKFGEEQRRKEEEIKACTAVFEKCSECYLQAVTHILKQ
ncbi:hypothetical protein C8R48DRAFT_669328 [Suillus tomentosus]|nr:hypothetical protein C8R48DRAFT_669328 [Suillus tomentosus]